MIRLLQWVLVITLPLAFPTATFAEECAWTVHQVTSGRLNTGNVSMSANGDRVVFLTFLADGTGSMIQMFDGQTASVRTLGSGHNPVINAAGTKVAFVTFANDLALMDIATGDTTVWPVGPVGLPILLSTDANRIAFISEDRNPEHLAQLFVLDVATGAITQVSHATYASRLGSGDIALSGDGSHIAWVEWAGMPSVRMYDFSTDRTRDLGYGYHPAVSYDGARVALLDETGALRVLEVESGLQRLLLTSERGFGSPAFSSDATRLVFLAGGDLVGANPDLDWEVFVADVSSGSVAQVTTGTGNYGVPLVAISANGTRVAFSDERPLSGPNREGNSEVFIGVCGQPDAAPYEFGGFEAPLVADGSASIRKGTNGRTIPVAFQLRRAGEIVTTALASLTVHQVLDTPTGTIDMTDLTTDAGQSSGNSGWFRYDAETRKYVFSLSTKNLPAPGTYQIRVLLDDRRVYTVNFSLR
ncbi:MAG TPA: PxKF domain-containing protein [Vicinamibacterales bacterium]|nr:PxKF domain-containing protein [Vicinamibacterales bacterium]